MEKGFKTIRGDRGFIPLILQYLFVGFNFLMAAIPVGILAMGNKSEITTGVLLGGLTAVLPFIAVWAAGSIILGIPVLLTRPEIVLIPHDFEKTKG